MESSAAAASTMSGTPGGLDNDTRGWIMCASSGVACVAGSSIICVDIIVRQFPGKHGFRIQDSNMFLACSLSLSFGVMLFSALYSMLPSSKAYLEQAGFSQSKAGLILMASFVAGFIGIQAISRILHQFMPSHVVDCDHSHNDQALEAGSRRPCSRSSVPPSRSRSLKIQGAMTNGHSQALPRSDPSDDGGYGTRLSEPLEAQEHTEHTEHTPLLANAHTRAVGDPCKPPLHHTATLPNLSSHQRDHDATAAADHRPSMLQVQKRVLSFVRDAKTNCDELGSCYGYSDPCGLECFKHLGTRSVASLRRDGPKPHPSLGFLRTNTGPFYNNNNSSNNSNSNSNSNSNNEVGVFRTARAALSRDVLPEYVAQHDAGCSSDSGEFAPSEREDADGSVDASAVPLRRSLSCQSHQSQPSRPRSAHTDPQHHHHVPTNAFMAIGLQTSIAIALHKFPEGFITYATNHANPALGFAVFMALFVHNISEGFAMALPLYMALGSRVKAMCWAAVLGGLSQPLGAALAMLWFKLAKGADMAPGAVFYAVLFAVTAGIMVSVALQLFVEGLSLNHDRNLCIFCGFLGMVLLGFSSAIAGHDH